uniref:cysteine dioxygenase n=1 Tax=Oryza sativa subsp. japonica TaxID=39947 RepID=Q6L546_ORYSJ|nr:unknown protein [Oryza sativa Japonica Group]
MDSRRLSFPVDRPRVHSAGLSSPPPLLITTTTSPPAASSAADWCLRLHGWPIMLSLLGVYIFITGLPSSPPIGVLAYTVGWSHHRSWASTSSPPACLRRRRLVSSPIRLVGHTTVHGRPRLHRPACLRRRRLVPPPTRLAYYAAAVGRLRLHRPACLRRRRLVPPPTRLAYYAAAVGRLRLHRRPASVAAEWCLRLHGWPIMPPLLGVYVFTAGLPPSPPSGASAYTAGLLCRRCWASTTSPPACLRRRRVVPPSTRLAYYAAAVGRLRLHRRLASVAAEWCLRLHGWPIMPPLLGVYDFTAGLPPSPPSGASVYTAGLLCRRCWASTTSPPACLRRRRVVPPPTRLAYYAAAVGRLRLHRRPASVAAEWCLRLHGWPIMPPLLGVYDFTAGLPPSPPSGASVYTAGLLCCRCWASTTSPPACLRRRRVVPPPTRLAYYAAAVGRLRLHRRPASVAAEWCLRLHGWPIMPPLLGVYDFTAGLPPSPPSGASAYTAGLLCRRCWMSTSSPLAHLRCRRLVFPLTRLTYYAAISGHLRFHRRPPSSPPTGVFIVIDGRLCSHIGHFCHHQGEYYKAKNGSVRTSPPACLRRRRLVFPPARLAYYAAVVGRLRLHRPACLRRRRLVFPPARLAFMPPLLGVYVFTDRLAFAAADWCFRLHGWPLCRRCWASMSSPTGLPSPLPTGVSACTAGLYAAVVGVYVFTDRPPRPPPTDVLACTAGLYAAVVGRLRLHRPACLRRRRLVFPPARLAFMPPLLGVYVFTDRLAFAAADWCFRLHGWPLCRRCWASTSSPTGRLVRRRPMSSPARLAFMPPLLGIYVFTDRPPRPPPTDVLACTAGLYAAVVGRLRLHRPACLRRRRLVFPPARLAFMPPLLGVYVFTDRLAFAAADWCHRLHGWPVITPTDATFFTAGYIAVTTNRHQYRQHKLPTFAMAADWFLHFHGCMILPVLIGLIFFTAGRLLPLLMDIIVFRCRLVMPPPTSAFIFTTARLRYQFAFVAADSCSLPHGDATLSSWWSDFIFIIFGTGKLYCCYFTNELGNNINSPPIICLHGWPTTQLPIEDLIVIIGCYIAIDWITDIVIFINILSSLINIAYSAAVDGKLRHHSRLSLLPLIIITVGCVCRRRLFSSSS